MNYRKSSIDSAFPSVRFVAHYLSKRKTTSGRKNVDNDGAFPDDVLVHIDHVGGHACTSRYCTVHYSVYMCSIHTFSAVHPPHKHI